MRSFISWNESSAIMNQDIEDHIEVLGMSTLVKDIVIEEASDDYEKGVLTFELRQTLIPDGLLFLIGEIGDLKVEGIQTDPTGSKYLELTIYF